MMPKIQAAGISWYKREDYLRARAIMKDAPVLPLTYELWLAKAEGQERSLKKSGFAVYRAFIDPEAFTTWCTSQGLDIDAKGRMAFASEFAARKVVN
jgi:hypothetical protein